VEGEPRANHTHQEAVSSMPPHQEDAHDEDTEDEDSEAEDDVDLSGVRNCALQNLCGTFVSF